MPTEPNRPANLPAGIPTNVAPRGNRKPVKFHTSDGRTVRLEQGVHIRPNESLVDICFVFDTTSSMNDKILGLQDSTVDLVRHLDTLDLDWRITTVPFGDLRVPGDRVISNQPFVSTRAEAEAQIHGMKRFWGGSNSSESAIQALSIALRKAYRKSAVKVLVLITDEHAYEDAECTFSSTALQLRQAEVICFVASPDTAYYRDFARAFGGTWSRIGSSMSNSELKKLLQDLVRQIPQVAREVHALSAGSVRRYLELPGRQAALDRPAED